MSGLNLSLRGRPQSEKTVSNGEFGNHRILLAACDMPQSGLGLRTVSHAPSFRPIFSSPSKALPSALHLTFIGDSIGQSPSSKKTHTLDRRFASFGKSVVAVVHYILKHN